jgi:transposase
MMKKNSFKTVLKFLLPFKSLRKIIRENLHKRNTNKIEKVNLEAEKWLKDYYKVDVEKLSLLLDKDLSDWTR